MARGRRRHSASPRRDGRRWWYAAAAAFATAATVLIAYSVWTPSGTGGSRTTAHQGTSARPAASRSASPSPSASNSTSASPSPSTSASPKADASKKSTPEPTTEADAPAPGRPSTAPAGKRLITVVNRTPKTVWAIVTNTAIYPKGRELAPGQSLSVTVANNWGGRIWGRTGCTSTAAGHCATGDCTSVCEGANPPTTLGEFTFDAYAGMDFYDVSMVDGSNLPMWINISHTTTVDPVSSRGCYKGVCTSDVNCPAAMRAVSGGQVVGCKPPCAAFGGDTYCCRGAWAGRENCVPSKWPVDYTQVFKKAAPYAYSYAFDDGATMPCKGACYYRITFGTTGS
ncbi:Thaumatin family protein [Streptomyces sp. 3213]|uniref:thaumatin family protein n=1 Tax=Streptomyces sp. 3213.3 TaxID=1855348 RepID=UPI00089B9A69|nr:thaumatin family protein [Streptomyces sp. 3213.3]SEE66103.1 Thaumatin family protein [Streptomyces sp. 3213] [Streptomyces sp. 3213.3]